MKRDAALVFALVTMVAACSSGGDDKSSEPTESTTATTSPALAAPGAEWETVDPAAVGLDATKLEAIAAVAEEGKSNCLVVVRDGKIAGEWYFRGTNPDSVQEVWSASKSISSTLVGIAQDDGDLKITDSASQYIPSWQGTPAEAVSVRDLLANDSGREWSVAIDYSQMLNAPDQTKFAEELGQPEPPGVTWAYNNSAIQTLDDVVSGATGTEPKDLAAARLFGPLGMTHTNMTTDSSGNTRMFMGVKSTCRDMARYGQLMLNKGRWGDKQIVSEAWVEDATGRSSTPLNAGYGYLWWLNREGVLSSALRATSVEAASNPETPRGRIADDAPDDMFWAIGLGNQIVQVDPGSKTVVVRLGTSEAVPRPPTFTPSDAARVVTEAVTN
jgi:CubicO group peptidase (beta-lactamase class C family)